MKLQITRKTELITTKWLGGTTTQLAIYPEGASYADRNYLFRISTATVEAEESVFTSLQGVSRIIMILDGVLRLEHKGRHTNTLSKFETDSFEGDWETRGFGKVWDFNLMTRDGVQGEVFGTSLMKDEIISFQFKNGSEFTGLYVIKGRMSISLPELHILADAGDFILGCPDGNEGQLEVKATELSEVAIARITFPKGKDAYFC